MMEHRGRLYVNKRSWHFRLNQWIGGPLYRPTNLCVYFWQTVTSIVFGVIFVFLAPPFLVCSGLWAGIRSLWKLWRRPNHEASTLPREPNLVVEYLKARKRRICPLLEVREEVKP